MPFKVDSSVKGHPPKVTKGVGFDLPRHLATSTQEKSNLYRRPQKKKDHWIKTRFIQSASTNPQSPCRHWRMLRSAGNFNFKIINRSTGSPARAPGSWVVCSTSNWCPRGGGHPKGWSTENLPGHGTPLGRKQGISKKQSLQARFESRLWQWPTLDVRECHLQLGVNKSILFAKGAGSIPFQLISIQWGGGHYWLDQSFQGGGGVQDPFLR